MHMQTPYSAACIYLFWNTHAHHTCSTYIHGHMDTCVDTYATPFQAESFNKYSALSHVIHLCHRVFYVVLSLGSLLPLGHLKELRRLDTLGSYLGGAIKVGGPLLLLSSHGTQGTCISVIFCL